MNLLLPYALRITDVETGKWHLEPGQTNMNDQAITMCAYKVRQMVRNNHQAGRPIRITIRNTAGNDVSHGMVARKLVATIKVLRRYKDSIYHDVDDMFDPPNEAKGVVATAFNNYFQRRLEGLITAIIEDSESDREPLVPLNTDKVYEWNNNSPDEMNYWLPRAISIIHRALNKDGEDKNHLIARFNSVKHQASLIDPFIDRVNNLHSGRWNISTEGITQF